MSQEIDYFPPVVMEIALEALVPEKRTSLIHHPLEPTMNIPTTLTFHDITFHPIGRDDGQIWLTTSDIAKGLGYARDTFVHRLYSRHEAEFTESMTEVVKLTTPGGKQDVRIFSLRGAHLLGMFARTPISAEFRRWILDVLDREVRRFGPQHEIDDAMSVPIALLSTLDKLANVMDRLVHELHLNSLNSRRLVTEFNRTTARMARMAAAQRTSNKGLDPDRPLDATETEQAEMLFRMGVPGREVARRLNRTHAVIARFISAHPELFLV